MKLRTTRQINGWQVSKDTEARQAVKGSTRAGKTARIIRTARILENIENQFIQQSQRAKIAEFKESRTISQRELRKAKRK